MCESLTPVQVAGLIGLLALLIANLVLLRAYRILFEIQKEQQFLYRLGEFEYMKRVSYGRINSLDKCIVNVNHPDWKQLSWLNRWYRFRKCEFIALINWMSGRCAYDASRNTFDWVYLR